MMSGPRMRGHCKALPKNGMSFAWLDFVNSDVRHCVKHAVKSSHHHSDEHSDETWSMQWGSCFTWGDATLITNVHFPAPALTLQACFLFDMFTSNS